MCRDSKNQTFRTMNYPFTNTTTRRLYIAPCSWKPRIIISTPSFEDSFKIVSTVEPCTRSAVVPIYLPCVSEVLKINSPLYFNQISFHTGLKPTFNIRHDHKFVALFYCVSFFSTKETTQKIVRVNGAC